MKTLKIALIGSGSTMIEHIKALKKIKEIQTKLVGVYSRKYINGLKLKKKFQIQKCFDSIDKMYEETKADIVIVVISAENLKKEIIKIAKFNWKIFTEKPVGINYDETYFIKKKIKNKINDIFVALNRLHYQSTVETLKIINKDKSKRIINIFDQEKFYENKILSKNLMYTNSIHLFCYCKLLARGNLNKIKTIKQNKNYILKELKFSSGDTIFFHSIWNRPAPWKIEISINDFYLILSPIEKLFVRKSDSHKPIEINKITKEKNLKPGFKNQLKFFLYQTLMKSKKYNFDYYLDTVKIIKSYYK
jgi:hypothetical protein